MGGWVGGWVDGAYLNAQAVDLVLVLVTLSLLDHALDLVGGETAWWVGGWVGGWVGWVEEDEAVRMSYWKLGFGWVGG